MHHSDRGVQYACREYGTRLEAAGARISMSAQGSPRENAQAESCFRTLKLEEVSRQDYRTFQEAEASIAHFLEAVTNQKRLHSALGYRPPCEYERYGLRGNSPDECPQIGVHIRVPCPPSAVMGNTWRFIQTRTTWYPGTRMGWGMCLYMIVKTIPPDG